MLTPVVAIVGLSDSGKTRVGVGLTGILSSWGYRIACIKHAPHGHQVDRPGSDSDQLTSAGAGITVVVSPDRMTSFQRTVGDLPLEEVVSTLGAGYDLVLAEGFKGSTVPKILVCGNEIESITLSTVIARVMTTRVRSDTPVYTFAELQELARYLEERFLKRSSGD